MICRLFHEGTRDGDFKYEVTLNDSIVDGRGSGTIEAPFGWLWNVNLPGYELQTPDGTRVPIKFDVPHRHPPKQVGDRFTFTFVADQWPKE